MALEALDENHMEKNRLGTNRWHQNKNSII
jgi:hypothetical protein